MMNQPNSTGKPPTPLPQRISNSERTATEQTNPVPSPGLLHRAKGMGKSSCFRGVTLFRPTSKWRAQVRSYSPTTLPVEPLNRAVASRFRAGEWVFMLSRQVSRLANPDILAERSTGAGKILFFHRNPPGQAPPGHRVCPSRYHPPYFQFYIPKRPRFGA